MDKRTCRGCGIEFQPTHGRQTCCSIECRKPNNRMVMKTCDACGAQCSKEARARYSGTYCNTLCRDYGVYGKSTCRIPKDHWARWYGRTSTWAPPAELMRNNGECDWCGEDNPRASTAAYCSVGCKTKAKRQRRRAREHGAAGEHRLSDVLRQYIRQGSACAYCRMPVDGLPHPEHVVPLARGGRNDMANIVASCALCNSDKRDLPLDVWQEDRERRGLPKVNIDLTGDMFPFLVLDDERSNICPLLAA